MALHDSTPTGAKGDNFATDAEFFEYEAVKLIAHEVERLMMSEISVHDRSSEPCNRPCCQPHAKTARAFHTATRAGGIWVVLIVGALSVVVMHPALAARNLDRSIGWPGETLSSQRCDGNDTNFGPLDYTDPDATRDYGKYARLTGGRVAPIKVVEGAHFNRDIERLISGKRSKDPAGDIDYTLRAFPNHHRALWAMSRYTLRRLRGVPKEDIRRVEAHPKGYPPAECYFNKALVFAPEDPMVSMIYGTYLHRRDALDKALDQYKRAEANMPKSAELMYNIGLLHADLGNIAEAEEYAARSTELGYPLKGLHKKIARMKAGDTPVK